MPSPEVIDLVHDLLKSSQLLADIKDWKKATGLITLIAPGCSIGIDKEDFEEYDRDRDEVTAHMRITIWDKNHDPVAGEASIRRFAQAARLILTNDRTLGGQVDESFVRGIEYATAEGDKSLIQHIVEIDYRVTYYSDRQIEEIVPAVDAVDNDLSAM